MIILDRRIDLANSPNVIFIASDYHAELLS